MIHVAILTMIVAIIRVARKTAANLNTYHLDLRI